MTLTDANELRIDYTRHDRQADAGQPDQPLLLQPGRSRGRARPRVDDRGGLLHACGRHLDPHRRDQAGQRHADGFHHARSRSARASRSCKCDPVGYDHNYVLNGGGKALALAARVYEPETRPRDGSAHHPARRAALHRQLTWMAR